VRAARAAPAPVAGNLYDKYGTRNPIARRLQSGFERDMFELLAALGPVSSVLEVGCGEGHMTARLARSFPAATVVGRDLSPVIVAEARARHPGLRFETQSVYDTAARGERFDLVVACEVLEHVDDPARALAAIAAAARFVFVSVPREPLWRLLNLARGRYVARLGDTPGHLQHWSRGALLELLATRLEVVAVRTPLPWIQVLGRVRA
jgi:2-polyprenyl-3-methyl-5-hydroxy-6-metoxy-1,4-benzoquinol methylase